MSLNFDGYGDKPEHEFRPGIDIEMRQSTYESMLLSPSRFGLSDAEGYDNTPSFAMFRGSLVHRLIELCIVGEKPYMELVLGPTIEKIAVDLAGDDDFDLHELAQPDQIARLVEHARSAFLGWHTNFWTAGGQNLTPLIVEEKLWRCLGVLPDGRAVWVHGTPDFVAEAQGVPVAFDWKTGGSPWSESKFLSKSQWPIYTWLMENRCPNLDMDWEVWVWSEKQDGWEYHEATMNARYVEAIMRNVWQMARAIAFEVFPAIPVHTAGPYNAKVRPWYARADFDPTWEINPFKVLLDDQNDDRKAVGW